MTKINSQKDTKKPWWQQSGKSLVAFLNSECKSQSNWFQSKCNYPVRKRYTFLKQSRTTCVDNISWMFSWHLKQWNRENIYFGYLKNQTNTVLYYLYGRATPDIFYKCKLYITYLYRWLSSGDYKCDANLFAINIEQAY